MGHNGHEGINGPSPTPESREGWTARIAPDGFVILANPGGEVKFGLAPDLIVARIQRLNELEFEVDQLKKRLLRLDHNKSVPALVSKLTEMSLKATMDGQRLDVCAAYAHAAIMLDQLRP